MLFDGFSIEIRQFSRDRVNITEQTFECVLNEQTNERTNGYNVLIRGIWPAGGNQPASQSETHREMERITFDIRKKKHTKSVSSKTEFCQF